MVTERQRELIERYRTDATAPGTRDGNWPDPDGRFPNAAEVARFLTEGFPLTRKELRYYRELLAAFRAVEAE